ncbi:hypothetical protein BH10BAC5_BH10BAC5_06020 [soil metagenome]
MDIIDRKYFWDNFPYHITQPVIDNIEKIIDYFDSKEYLISLKWLAYALATVKHETNETYAPVVEGYWIKGNRINALKNYYRGKPQYATIFPKTNKTYEGRGLVQLTHNFNYKNMSKLVGVDLLLFPEKALDPDIAVKILFEGMFRGIFTGFKFINFLSASKTDYEGARKIINGKDKKALIAGYASAFYDALEFEEIINT